MVSDCDNLDAYLLGDLVGDDTARFEQHLASCAACREAIDEQRWLDGLLQSPGRLDVELPPDAIVDSILASVARHGKQRWLAACVLAVAAVLIVAVGWTLWAGRGPQGNPAGQVADTRSPGDSHDRRRPTLRVGARLVPARPQPPGSDTAFAKAVVIGDENTIAVPVESRYPNVTVVRVYPVYQPKYAAQATTSRPQDVDEFAWPENINGG